MRYRTFVMLSSGGMILTGALAVWFFSWLDPEVDPTRTLLITALLTGFVLALDLLMWRLAPDALESAGFQLGEHARRHRREDPPVEEYAVEDGLVSVGPRSVYRMDLGLRILIYALGAILVLTGLGLGALYLAGVDTDGRHKDIGPVGNAFFVLFFVTIGASLWWAGRRTRLVLSEGGVEYRTLGYSVTTGWRNVRAIGPARYSRGREVESLLLREPGLRGKGVFGALVTAIGSGPEDATPLQEFGSARYGPLARDLKRYAPDLFGDDGRPLPPASPP